MTGALPSDGSLSLSRTLAEGVSYPSAEFQSAYSIPLANRASTEKKVNL